MEDPSRVPAGCQRHLESGMVVPAISEHVSYSPVYSIKVWPVYLYWTTCADHPEDKNNFDDNP